MCIDTFYIWKLKGVGKLWQITACDAASSYALAKVVVVCNASEAAAFLKQVVVPTLAEAGWRLQRVLTDGGSGCKGEFDVTCRELNVRHTRTKPRHAWTNGFVERLQQTILHVHWRIASGRRYFRKRLQLRMSLEGGSGSATSSAPIRATAPKDALQLRCSGVRSNYEVHQEA